MICRCSCAHCWKTRNLATPGKDPRNSWGHCLYCGWIPSTLAADHPVERVGSYARDWEWFVPWSGRR